MERHTIPTDEPVTVGTRVRTCLVPEGHPAYFEGVVYETNETKAGVEDAAGVRRVFTLRSLEVVPRASDDSTRLAIRTLALAQADHEETYAAWMDAGMPRIGSVSEGVAAADERLSQVQREIAETYGDAAYEAACAACDEACGARGTTEENATSLRGLAASSLPAPQLAAINAQVAAYSDPNAPCQGLKSYRVCDPSEWDTPVEQVTVEFTYIHDDEGGPGLEVTTFAPDGSVVDSQDLG